MLVGWYLPLLTEAEDVNTGTGSDGGKKMKIGTRRGILTALELRLVRVNDHPGHFGIDLFPAGEGDLNVHDGSFSKIFPSL